MSSNWETLDNLLRHRGKADHSMRDDLTTVYNDELYAKKRKNKIRIALIALVAIGLCYIFVWVPLQHSPSSAAVSYIIHPENSEAINKLIGSYGLSTDELAQENVINSLQIETEPCKKFTVKVRVVFRKGSLLQEGCLTLLLTETDFQTGKYYVEKIQGFEPPANKQ